MTLNTLFLIETPNLIFTAKTPSAPRKPKPDHFEILFLEKDKSSSLAWRTWRLGGLIFFF
jgi:hypothetical protein